MAKAKAVARVITRLDPEEQALLERARKLTGYNTSGVIKAALRVYSATLPKGSALDIFEEHGLVGASSGPTDLSETYKRYIDYSCKHAEGS